LPEGRTAFLLARVARLVLVLLGATVLLFGLTLLIPGNPAQVLLGPRASAATIAAFTHEMGLDRPAWQRLLIFLDHVLHGNFGTDVVSGRPIFRMVMDVVPFTIALAGSGILIAIVLGVPIGCLSAARPGGLLDRLTAALSVGFIAIPNFVVALFLLIAFSVWLKWLPVLGTGPSGGSTLLRLILPAASLAIGWIGYIARLLRASLLDVLSEPHVRTLRAYGLQEPLIIGRFALRLASLPLVALLGLGVGQLLGGAIFAEIVFARPGIGTLIFDSIGSRDYPVVQAAVLVTVFLFTITNLFMEALQSWLDPRTAA
jgi:peptide/nickel transport system permease protein